MSACLLSKWPKLEWDHNVVSWVFLPSLQEDGVVTLCHLLKCLQLGSRDLIVKKMCLITGLFPPEALHSNVNFQLQILDLLIFAVWRPISFCVTFLLRPSSCLLQLAVLFAYLHNHWAILYVAGYHNHWTILYIASCVSPNNVNLSPDLPPIACDLQYSLPTYRAGRVGSMVYPICKGGDDCCVPEGSTA